MKIIICSLILAAPLWLAITVMDAYGFGSYMALCGVATGLTIAAVFAWDWYEARR